MLAGGLGDEVGGGARLGPERFEDQFSMLKGVGHRYVHFSDQAVVVGTLYYRYRGFAFIAKSVVLRHVCHVVREDLGGGGSDFVLEPDTYFTVDLENLHLEEFRGGAIRGEFTGEGVGHS